jgi:hypothetical protein
MAQRFTARYLSLLAASVAATTGLILGVAAETLQRTSDSESVIPVDAALCNEMKVHHVIGAKAPVGCERLDLVRFSYIGFDKQVHGDGEVVVMDAVAVHVANILRLLRERDFPIAKARLMNQYDGDDDASMADNNTSAFNDRNIANGGSVSLHAYGLAIDVNPLQNPYLTGSNGVLRISPLAGLKYVNRNADRLGKRPRAGMVEPIIDIFADNGFLIWGGYWTNPIDYQHFQISRKMAERLVAANAQEAASIFDALVQRYRDCRRGSAGESASSLVQCIITADPDASSGN